TVRCPSPHACREEQSTMGCPSPRACREQRSTAGCPSPHACREGQCTAGCPSPRLRGEGAGKRRVRGAIASMTILFASHLSAQLCPIPPGGPDVCIEGAIGNATPDSFQSLAIVEVRAIVETAASSTKVNTLTIAVVDRAGRPL